MSSYTATTGAVYAICTLRTATGRQRRLLRETAREMCTTVDRHYGNDIIAIRRDPPRYVIQAATMDQLRDEVEQWEKVAER